MEKIAVIGTGAWGTALANILLKNKHQVCMFGRNVEQVKDLNNRCNKKFFGNKKMAGKLEFATSNMEDIYNFKPKYIVLATPSIAIVPMVKILVKNFSNITLINVAKGFDPESKKILSKAIKKVIGKKDIKVVTLIGPSFATEVFDNQPTIINAVSKNTKAIKHVTKLFNNNTFKCIKLKDEVGAETISALKNVMAIALGVAYEQHTSINTRAAMLSEAVKEISKIIEKLGGDRITITQFCGIGDIYLTCTDSKSRNFSFGQKIAQDGITKAVSQNDKTVEGYETAKTIHEIIVKKNIKAPLFEEIFKVLYSKQNPKDLVSNVMKHIID